MDIVISFWTDIKFFEKCMPEGKVADSEFLAYIIVYFDNRSIMQFLNRMYMNELSESRHKNETRSV